MPIATVFCRPHRVFSARILLCCVFLVAAGTLAEAWATSSFFRTAERIDVIIRQSQTRSSDWGIFVQDALTGQPLYAHNGLAQRVPASTQKLLTAAVALDVLGRNHRYETRLYFNGTIDGNLMRGDIILEGSGDPTLGSREIERADPFRIWAEQLASMGVTRFEGRIVGDDSRFDGVRYPGTWKDDHIRDKTYAPATSALSYHDNLIDLSFAAPRSGQPVRISSDPPGYMTIENQTRTTGSRRRISFDRALYSETVRFAGRVPRGYRAKRTLPVHNPTAFAVHSFRFHMNEVGISTQSQLLTTDDLLGRPSITKKQPMFVHQSPPLLEILQIMNKESDNLYAEQVFRSISRDGSLESSAGRVKALFQRAGINPDEATVRDGSGLSRANQITPQAMTQLLTFMYHHSEGDAFLATLPYGGEQSTTLKNRLDGVPVQAKTGTLRAVKTLSGFANAPNGRLVSFAIFANDFNVSSRHVTQTIDAIVLALTNEEAG